MTRKGKNSNKNKSGYRDIGLYQSLIRGAILFVLSYTYQSQFFQFATSAFSNSTVAETQPICVFQYLQEKEQREN